MSSSPARSWIDTIKAYFWLCFFLFATFMLSYGLTGQYLVGVFVGIVILYFTYRLFFVVGDLSFTPGITRPAVSFAIVAGVLALIAILGFIFPLPPTRYPDEKDLIRHALIFGIPVLLGAVGYVYTRIRK